MEKYFEINAEGQNIRCKLYTEKKMEVRHVIVSLHGFAGHKDNKAAQRFAERVLTKYKGTVVLTFDLPCHGNDVKKKMTLTDCMTYLRLVVAYIRQEWQESEIYAYATSFGGYLVLKYIAEQENPFVKIALRCPAVDMAAVLEKTVMQDGDRDKLLKGKPVKVGFDRKIEITKAFLQELEASDIRKNCYLEDAENILVLHGTKDEVVPLEASQSFAEENLLTFVPIEKADHRFQDPGCMEQATKQVLAFFEL